MNKTITKITIDGIEKTGLISDGYHTFDELYNHRITLYIALCKNLESPVGDWRNVWRSHLHSDGSRFDGWFLLGIGTQAGHQITYHIPNERWDETEFAETLNKAPEFDGHSSTNVLDRLKKL